MTSLIAEYPRKSLADFTQDDRESARRYEQGKTHAKQGRSDLVGLCRHYDAGHDAAWYEADVDYYDRMHGIR